MASIYKRNVKGTLVWYLRYKDPTGNWRDRSCGKDVKTKKEAELISAVYTAQELNNRHRAPVRVVGADLESALAEFKDTELSTPGKEESSVAREKGVVNTISDYLNENGIKKFDQIDVGTIKKYMADRSVLGRKNRSIREELRIFKKFFKFAVKRSYCSINPTDDEEIKTPKLVPKHPRFYSKAELQKIFQNSNGVYHEIYKFLYCTGLRSGEIRNLEWRDFKEDEKKIEIRVMSGNKTKRQGSVPLNACALGIIKRIREEKRHPTYVFTNEDNNQLDNDNIRRNLLRVLDRAEITDGTTHTFRHTTASHLVMQGVSIYTVKDLLRHKSVKETEIYAHLSSNVVEKAVDLLDA